MTLVRNSDGLLVKMMSFFCAKCEQVKMIPARRGRPPQYCASCTETGDAEKHHNEVEQTERKQTAIERIDNLELMLKSRGLHLSQQKDRW